MKHTQCPAGKAQNYTGKNREPAIAAKATGSMNRKTAAAKTVVEKVSKTAYIKIVKTDAKRGGTAAGERFLSAVKFMAKNANKKISLDVLMANSKYRMSDYRHDLKKGFIKVVGA